MKRVTHFNGTVELVDDAADVALAAASAVVDQAALDKNDAARAAVKAEVQRILAKSAGTRTVTEKAFLGLAWLVFREEG